MDNLHDIVNEPTLNTQLSDHKVIMTACGVNHSLCLTSRGQVFSAGLNDFGQLGIVPELIAQNNLDSKKLDNDYKIDLFYQIRT